MTTMNITLPEALRAFIEEQAAKNGFETVSEYVRAVFHEVQEKNRERERIDALLMEGLDSGPATPLTAADWDLIRREGMKLITARTPERT